MWWRELHRRRERGLAISPLSFREIEAWSGQTGARATPFEVGLIVQIDNAFIDWSDGLPPEAEAAPPQPTRPITEALFDALFT